MTPTNPPEYARRYRAAKALEAGREPGKPGRPVSAPCGTQAAYKRHKRRGETACDACRTAYLEYQRELYRARHARKPGSK